MKFILKKIRNEIILDRINNKWRKSNLHNFTSIANLCDINKIYVGNYTYGNIRVRTFKNSSEKLNIGSYCSIAENVTFLLGGEHDYHTFMTYPIMNLVDNSYIAQTKGSIKIDNDVWIGENCTILSGVHISQGAIIGAGSIVYKDIPPYCIYTNNGIIKKRFDDEIINSLIQINFDNITMDDLTKNIQMFTKKMDIDIAKSLLETFHE